MRKQTFCRRCLPAALVLISFATAAADTLRVANWNVTNYSGGRVAEFQTSIYGQYSGRSMAPDILVGQEFTSASAVTAFRNLLNTAAGSPGDWAAAAFVDGPDTDSAFFYRTSRVSLAADLSPNGVTIVAVGGNSPLPPRNIMRYDVVVAAGTSAEARVAIYGTHMKSGTAADDQARRLLEAQIIRDDAEVLPANWYFLIGGDFNIQSSGQSAYQELVGSFANNDGRFFDPIATPGSWNNNAAFRIVHTQDPAGDGGMDDRHDQILLCGGLVDGVGLDYIGNPSIPYSTTTWNDANHSYRSWGNDGTSYNVSLKIAGNTMVGPTIAQALVTAAGSGGHLPVFLDLRVPPCPADFDCDTDVDMDDADEFEACMTGPATDVGWVAPELACLEIFNLGDDEDVDVLDFATFQTAFTGP